MSKITAINISMIVGLIVAMSFIWMPVSPNPTLLNIWAASAAVITYTLSTLAYLKKYTGCGYYMFPVIGTALSGWLLLG